MAQSELKYIKTIVEEFIYLDSNILSTETDVPYV